MRVCATDPDPDCQEDYRIEVLTGQDVSPNVRVRPSDSIINRIVKALQYLGWTNYLNGNNLIWSKIAVAGHSQGSGHAAMIGRFFLTDRVVIFSGMEPAPWTTKTRVTPPASTWAFCHEDDGTFGAFTRAWTNLMIPGAPETVDGVSPPYMGSHQLTTTVPPHPSDPNPHRATVVDTATPRDAQGRSIYVPVWCHMLGT